MWTRISDRIRIAVVALVVSGLLAGVLVAVAVPGDAGKADTTPPVRSEGAPTGALPAGTKSTDISLKTNEAATCRYSTTSGVAYPRMKNDFSTTGGTSHSTPVSGLMDGNTYRYYVRCKDLAGNANPDDYVISFTIRASGDCGVPSGSSTGYASAPLGTPASVSPAPVAGSWKVVASPSVESASPSIYVDNALRGIDAISTDDAWAVGDAYDPNGPQYAIRTLALHWDGTQWSRIPTPTHPLSTQSAINGVWPNTPSDVWAVGDNGLIEHYDGASWTAFGQADAGTAPTLRAVWSSGPNDAWAVGFCAGWYTSSTLILHWDGASWSRVPSPNPSAGSGSNQLFGISATSANDIWAVGVSSGSTSAFAPLALHWDGAAWSAIPTSTLYGGGYGSFFRSVSGVSSDDVLAVGATVVPAGFEGGTRNWAFAAHWDGTAWTQILDINRIDSSEYSYSTNFYGVSAVAHDFAWVVGEDTGDALIYRWNGTALNEVPAPALPWYNTLYAVDALPTDSAWAVGRYAIEGVSGTKTLTERYPVP